MQYTQDIHFSPLAIDLVNQNKMRVNNQFPGTFHTTVATFIRLPGRGCWLNNQSVRPVQWRPSGSAPQCTHECASCPAGQHGPEYLHHLSATFLLISSRHAAARIRPCHGEAHRRARVADVLPQPVTEPGIMLPFNGLAHKIPD